MARLRAQIEAADRHDDLTRAAALAKALGDIRRAEARALELLAAGEGAPHRADGRGRNVER